MTGNEHDAEDIVQETFLRAYRARGQFEARSSFRTWLHRVAINCALDHLRRVKRREEESYESAGAEEEEVDLLGTIPSDSPTPERLLLSVELKKKIGGSDDRTHGPRARGVCAAAFRRLLD